MHACTQTDNDAGVRQTARQSGMQAAAVAKEDVRTNIPERIWVPQAEKRTSKVRSLCPSREKSNFATAI
jgi:hypothetical protein